MVLVVVVVVVLYNYEYHIWAASSENMPSNMSKKWITSSASIQHKSIAGRYRPVRVADGPIKARCRFINNASWVNIILHMRKVCPGICSPLKHSIISNDSVSKQPIPCVGPSLSAYAGEDTLLHCVSHMIISI